MGVIKVLFELLEGIVTGTVEALFDFVQSFISREKKTVYDADFAPRETVLSAGHKGFMFGDRAIDLHSSFRNALIFGNTGSGKNVSVLVPSILNMMGTSSLVINDPSEQLHLLCSGAVHAASVDLKILNYGRPELGGFNPMIRAKNPSDLAKIAKVLVATSLGQSKDPFWNVAATDLLTVMMRIVQHAPPEQRHMHNVLRVLNRFSFAPKDIDRLCVASGNDALISDYKTYVSYDIKMLMSIVATCRASLSIFNDPQVALATSYDTIDIDGWRKRPTCLFIHSSIPDMKYYAPLTSLLCEQIFAHLMSRIPSPDELPVFTLLDEASSLHLHNTLPVTFSNIRKHSGGILAVYQSPFQLIDAFNQSGAKSIEENAFAKLYLPGVHIDVATALERTLGKFEYVDEKDIRHTRSLMTANEIRESSESLLLTGNNRAIRLNLKPFYKQPKLKKLTDLLPFTPPSTLPFTQPPLIQFD